MKQIHKRNILIVEDDINQAKVLAKYLTHHGYFVSHAKSAEEAEEILFSNRIDIVLMDWKLPDKDGLDFITEFRDRFPFTQFIMITAFGTIEKAVEAMKAGAYHYLTKPINLEELVVVIEKAAREAKLEQEVQALRRKLKSLSPIEAPDVVAESPKMKEVLSMIRKIAVTNVTVLIIGESGTGKELIADLIHNLSPRKEKPFLKINCAAIPEGLLESELFGYEKGAFTGADRLKIGVFEIANGGSLFLDEIGDMPLSLQSKLLRVLQDGSFLRVGGTREIRVDVRIIAATNRNLKELIEKGKFREDLYWRLNVFPIILPPLRERRDDIIPLAKHFLRKYSHKLGKKEVKEISREAIERLMSYSFPGNIRELEHIIERAVILAENELITKEDLQLDTSASSSAKGCKIEEEPESCPFWQLPLNEAIRMLEKKRIDFALKKTNGVKTKAAELLNISERMLRYKLENLRSKDEK